MTYDVRSSITKSTPEKPALCIYNSFWLGSFFWQKKGKILFFLFHVGSIRTTFSSFSSSSFCSIRKTNLCSKCMRIYCHCNISIRVTHWAFNFLYVNCKKKKHPHSVNLVSPPLDWLHFHCQLFWLWTKCPRVHLHFLEQMDRTLLTGGTSKHSSRIAIELIYLIQFVL